MGFFDELIDSVASAFDSEEDQEAMAAVKVAEDKEVAAQKLVDEGVAVNLRIHGPYPRNPDAADCDGWLASGRTSCADFDEHSRCESDHKPEPFVSGTSQTVADSVAFVLPSDNVCRVAFHAIGANDKDHMLVTHGVAGEDIKPPAAGLNAALTFGEVIAKGTDLIYQI